MSAAVKAVQSATKGNERALVAEEYRAEIDGLRGIAVLAVLGFHAFPEYFPGGYVGVDVFFVVSGFLISRLILRQLRRSTFRIPDFYARRVRRIFPSLLIVLIACLLLGALVLLPDELEELGKHVGSAAIFTSNFTLWMEAGYFDAAAELKPLRHLWSLGIEEQFYLLWPVLLLLLWRRPKSVRFNVALLTVASFVLCLAVGSRSSVANFYLPLSRFWELGAGCLLAVLKESTGSIGAWFDDRPLHFSRYGRLAQITNSTLPIVGVVLIGVSILAFNPATLFPGWAALVPTVGAMCIIVGRSDSWFQRTVMASGALVFVGLISYPLYLWHWPLLSFVAILDAGHPDSAVRFAMTVLSFVLAWLTFVLFERPVRAQRSTRVSLALAAGLAILGVAGLTLYFARGFPDRFDLVRALTPAPRTNALCPTEFDAHRTFNYCKSTQAEPPGAVFLGDSRAQGVYDGVAEELGTRYALTLLGRGGCPPLLGVGLHYIDQQRCQETWETFVRYVETVKPRAVVIVGGGAELLDPSEARLEPGSRFTTQEEAFKHGLRQLVTTLAGTSQVIYIRQLPQFQSAPSCFLRPIRMPGSRCAPTLPRKAVEAENAPIDRILDELRDEVPGLQLVESVAPLCGPESCSQKLPSGDVIYIDQLHLSPAGGRYFARSSGLAELIEKALAPTASPHAALSE